MTIASLTVDTDANSLRTKSTVFEIELPLVERNGNKYTRNSVEGQYANHAVVGNCDSKLNHRMRSKCT